MNTLEDTFPPVLIDGSNADNAPAKYFIGGVILQRPSLTQIGNTIYGGFGGHCDLFNYTGLVVGVDVIQQKVVTSFAVESGPLVPQTNIWNQNGGGGEGGIWMSGMALATDGANRLFWVSGNGVGHENQGAPASGSSGCKTLGEAAVNLAVGDGGKLSLTDYFQPYDYQGMDGGDQDFGSGGIALLDSGTFKGTGVSKIAVTSGKNGKIYILNANNLGGYKLGPGQTDGIIQTIVTNKAVFGGVGSYPLEGGYIYSTPVGYPTYVYKLGFTGSGVPSFTSVGHTAANSAGRVGVGIPTVTSYQGKEGTGILWMCDPDAGLRAWHAVPGPDGLLQPITIPQVNGLNKFQRPAFGDTRLYVTDAQGTIYCLGSPVNLPLTCTSPVNFGSVALGSSATQTVQCTANIAITNIADVTVGDAHFEVNINDLPRGAIAKGSSFSFPVIWNLTSTTVSNAQNASYGNTSPGIKSTALTIQTVNAVQGYSTKFPISLTGTQVSQKPFAVIAPITVDFGGVVITDPADIATITSPFVISNAGISPMTILGYAYTTDELDDDDIDYTNVTLTQSPYVLGEGFSSTNLPPVGTVIQGGAEISVDANFSPNEVGSYSSYFFVFTNGGAPFTILEGSASTAPVANFSISTSEGGWLPESNLVMDFGNVAPGTTSSREIRICNEGGSALEISKSKPPNGEGFRPDDPNALHESQQIPVNQCAYATVLFITNAEQPNTPDQTFTNSWTLNTNDLGFGVHVVEMTGTVVSRKVGPTNSTGQPVYQYLGCYHEIKPGGRLLPDPQYADNKNTNDRCQTGCLAGNYVFSGTEYQTECYCGNKPPSGLYRAEEQYCNYACSGDGSETCGGLQVGAGGYISIYYDASRYTPNPNDTTGTSPVSGEPSTIPRVGNYDYVGCYSEATAGRALGGKAPPAPDDGTTIESCLASCQGYKYFGMEFSNECYCGDSFGAGAALQESQDRDVNGCSMTCGGNATEYCGGPNRLDVFMLNTSLPAPTGTPTPPTPGGPSNSPTIDDYQYLGCYTEGTNGRALSGKLNPVGGATLTNEICAAACKGFTYFGTEYGGECYCGNIFAVGAILAPGGSDHTQKGCSVTCNGNSTEYCGGGNRLTVYKLNATSTATGTATATSAVATSDGPAIKQSIGPWIYNGCYSEATQGRALDGLQNPVPGASLTLESCAAACAAYSYFGTEYSGECYCGNSFHAGAVLVPGGDDQDISGCSMLCNGNQNEYCGGPNRLSTFKRNVTSTSSSSIVMSTATTSNTATTAPTPTGPTVVERVGAYAFQGCYTEATAQRALTGAAFYNTAMTIEMCAQNCAGFTWMGVEYGQECYCGSQPNPGSVKALVQSECNLLCPGDSTEYCGAGNRLQMYKVDTTGDRIAAASLATSSTTSTSSITNPQKTFLTTSVTSTTAPSTTFPPTSSVASSISSSITPSTTSSTTLLANAAHTSSITPSTVSTASIIVPSTTSSITSSTTSPTSLLTSTTSTTKTTSSTTFSPTPGQTIANWAYLGCANETKPRALSGASYSSSTLMTVESCQSFCSSNTNNYALAGLENGQECYCGNGLQSYSAVGYAQCSKPCKGNSSEICGGSSRISLYNLTTYVPPTTVKQVGTYLSQGCYSEASKGRLLSGKSYSNKTSMTVESCVNFCSANGGSYAGVENGQECYCGTSLPSGAATTDASQCNMLCTGNIREFCGASKLLNVYKDTPGSVSSNGAPVTANQKNVASIKANTTSPATGSFKEKRKERKMGFVSRVKLSWERAMS